MTEAQPENQPVEKTETVEAPKTTTTTETVEQGGRAETTEKAPLPDTEGEKA